MLCDECKIRPASVHVTKIVNNHKTEINLCQQCAREKGEDLGFLIQPQFSLQQLISGMLSAEQGARTGSLGRSSYRCSHCGQDYAEFSQTGFLGCPECYQQYEAELGPVLRRIHGTVVHKGKIPRHAGHTAALRCRVDQLRAELQQRISREEYEKAAELRDEIRRLEEELARPAPDGDGGDD